MKESKPGGRKCNKLKVRQKYAFRKRNYFVFFFFSIFFFKIHNFMRRTFFFSYFATTQSLFVVWLKLYMSTFVIINCFNRFWKLNFTQHSPWIFKSTLDLKTWLNYTLEYRQTKLYIITKYRMNQQNGKRSC